MCYVCDEENIREFREYDSETIVDDMIIALWKLDIITKKENGEMVMGTIDVDWDEYCPYRYR